MLARALLLGNNYVGTDSELKGCFNDCESLNACLALAGCVSASRCTTMREASARQIVEGHYR